MNKVTSDNESLASYNYDEAHGSIKSSQAVRLFRNLEGRMLTIVDACIPAGQQADAMKSLVRVSINECRQSVLDWLSTQKDGMASGFPY